MSDPLEQAIRRAASELGSAAGRQPSYHDAWERGRRRRLVKRGAIAAAAAVALVAAIGINVAGLPGGGSAQEREVALEVVEATALPESTAVATTAPISPPPAEPAGPTPVDTDDPLSSSPAPSPVASSPSPPPAPSPTESPTEPTPTALQPTAVVESAPQAPSGPAPTAEPTADKPALTGPATPVPTPDVAGSTAGIEDPTAPPIPDLARTPGPALPSEAPTPTPVPSSSDGDPPAGVTLGPTSPSQDEPDTPQSTVPPIAATSPAPPSPDAVAVTPPVGTDVGCDTTGDGSADASCTLLADYACTGSGDVLASYAARDTDGDGVLDTCQTTETTRCDTTGDGRADVPCRITPNSPQAPTDQDAVNE